MTFQKHCLFDIAVAVLVGFAFAIGVFFRGFEQAIFAPALLMILLAGGAMMAHGMRTGWALPSAGSAIALALF